MRAGLRVLVATVLALSVAGCAKGHAVSASSPPSPAASSTRPQPTPTHASSAVDPDAQLSLIDHVHWGSTDKGKQLQVYPTKAGRTDTFPAASTRAWAEILAAAPNADTPGMHDQFLCHWNFARLVDPDKPSWDLEPWRPAVGYPATVAAQCNPGGSES